MRQIIQMAVVRCHHPTLCSEQLMQWESKSVPCACCFISLSVWKQQGRKRRYPLCLCSGQPGRRRGGAQRFWKMAISCLCCTLSSRDIGRSSLTSTPEPAFILPASLSTAQRPQNCYTGDDAGHRQHVKKQVDQNLVLCRLATSRRNSLWVSLSLDLEFSSCHWRAPQLLMTYQRDDHIHRTLHQSTDPGE